MKVGVGQIPILMGKKASNVSALLHYVHEAARRRCQVVVFPECSLAGWLSDRAIPAAEPIPGPLTRTLAALAQKHRMGIVLGMEERSGKKIYNSAVLIGPQGELLARHRKIDELKIGLRIYSRGGTLGVAELRGRTVGLDICADSWKPPLTDALALMGARIIFSPCAWAAEPGGESTNLAWIRETYRERTRGRPLTIVAANGVGPVTEGPWRGRLLQGNSLVVGPGGKVLLEGPTSTPALLVARVP